MALVMISCWLVMLAGCSRPPSAQRSLTVEITGDDYNWHIRYPGLDGELGTPDDVWTLRHLHLPAATAVELKLLSRDFLYNFWLPDRDVYQIAVPGVPMGASFDSGHAREAELLGDQMCGFSHEDLIGELVVQELEDFENWLETQRAMNAGELSDGTGGHEG
jgi:cytochrome c oxidase subunit 2